MAPVRVTPAGSARGVWLIGGVQCGWLRHRSSGGKGQTSGPRYELSIRSCKDVNLVNSMTQPNRELPRLGAKVRALRRRGSLSQVQLAERLGISASYLNLIESNRRPLPAGLLIKLAQIFEVDLHAFGGDGDARMVNDLIEAFADPLFDTYQLTSADLRDLTLNHPQIARAIIALYSSYKTQRASTEELAERLEGDEASGM